MITKTIKGPTRVIFPNGKYLKSSQHVQFQCQRTDIHETWFCGVLVERTEEVIDTIEGYRIGACDPIAGTDKFVVHDRTYDLVDDYDIDFWRLPGTLKTIMLPSKLSDGTDVMVPYTNADDPRCYEPGEAVTYEEWFTELKIRNIEGIYAGERAGWWTVDDEGNPRANGIRVSIAELQAQNKPLMAHLMHDLGFFPSVGQARKNGWDKPLELGTHELGPKKKRITVEIVE